MGVLYFLSVSRRSSSRRFVRKRAPGVSRNPPCPLEPPRPHLRVLALPWVHKGTSRLRGRMGGLLGSVAPRGKKNWSVRGRTGDRTRDLLYACVRGARRRRGLKTGIIPLCWNLFTGLTIRPSVPKLKFIGGGERSFGLHTCGEKCFFAKR